MIRRLFDTALGLVVGGAFYLLLIDTTDLPELYVLGGVSLLAGLAFAASSELGFPEASPRTSWVARGWRAVARIPSNVLVLAWEVIVQLRDRRPVRGALRAAPFKAGHSGRDLGRIALAEALGSLAPNTIVLGVDPETDLLLVHQLHRRGGREELDVLDLG